jgi:hypothetical protein
MADPRQSAEHKKFLGSVLTENKIVEDRIKKLNDKQKAELDQYNSGIPTASERQKMEIERQRAKDAEAASKRYGEITGVPQPKPRSEFIEGKKMGGAVKKYARGGGVETRGKTKGRFV